MLINNSTRILNDSWDRDKWKTIATSIKKKKNSVVIDVLILTGLRRDPGADSWNILAGERREEIEAHLTSWHLFNREGEETISLCLFPHYYFVSSGSWHICRYICSSDVWGHALSLPCFVSLGITTSGSCESLRVFTVQLCLSYGSLSSSSLLLHFE